MGGSVMSEQKKLSNYRENFVGGVDADRELESGEIVPYTLTPDEVNKVKADKATVKKKTQAEKDAIAKDEARRALKAERDAALQAIVFDLGAGKSVQVRPQDISNFQLAISRTTDPIDWVLSDNSVEPLSIDILRQALAFGVNEGERIWKQYTDQLKVI